MEFHWNDPSGIDGGAYDLRMIPLESNRANRNFERKSVNIIWKWCNCCVINIIPNEVEINPSVVQEHWANGSFNTRKAVATVAGQTSIFDYNVGYSLFGFGWFQWSQDLTGNGSFDKDGVTQNSLQANLELPHKSLSLKPFFRYNTFISNYDDGSFQDSKVDHSKSELINTGLSGPNIKLNRDQLTLCTDILILHDRTPRVTVFRITKGDFKMRTFSGIRIYQTMFKF